MGSPKSAWLLVLGVAAFLVGTAWAQEAVLQDLHARGYVGLNYDRDSSENSSGQGIGEEISTDWQGAILNPQFLSFGSSFSFSHSTASVNSGLAAADNTFAGSANVMFLPGSAYPLSITYQRTRVGIGQSGFSSATDTDRLGFDWRLNLSRLPKFAVRYERDSSSSDVPVGSFVPLDSRSNGFSVSANDTFKGWEWDAGWMHSSSSMSEFLVDQPATLEQTYSIGSANVFKRYFENKGTFNYNFSRSEIDTAESVLSALNGVQTSQSASTGIRFTPKLTASGSFQYYTYSNEGRMAKAPGATDYTYIVSYPAHGYTLGGGVNYQIHPRISISDSASYADASAPPTAQEQATTFVTNTPAVNANYTWRRIRLSGSYGLQYTGPSTNFGRTFAGFNNTGSVSAAWTHPWISLSGGFGIGHGTSGVLPGAYADTTNYTFTAESSKLHRIGNLRFRWEILNRTLLGSTGFIETRRTNWSVALTRKFFQVEGGANSGSGARQAFGQAVGPFQPVPALIGTLLLDDDVQNYYVTASGMLRRNLRVNGTYRRDINQIRAAGGAANYSLYEIYVDYRVGKIVIDASYGHYMNFSDTLASRWGSSADRFRFRIVRTFDLF